VRVRDLKWLRVLNDNVEDSGCLFVNRGLSDQLTKKEGRRVE
jgi:hypothetical protein